MECPKCEGLMIEESVPDSSGCINQWRCVNCGAILDAIIALISCGVRRVVAHSKSRPGGDASAGVVETPGVRLVSAGAGYRGTS